MRLNLDHKSSYNFLLYGTYLCCPNYCLYVVQLITTQISIQVLNHTKQRHELLADSMGTSYIYAAQDCMLLYIQHFKVALTMHVCAEITGGTVDAGDSVIATLLTSPETATAGIYLQQ